MVSPVDYERLLETLKKNNGSSDIDSRLQLAKTAMDYLSAYLDNISEYYRKLSPSAVKKEYKVD